MHIEALPYAEQLSNHADEIQRHQEAGDWDEYVPVRLEISLVYTAVVIRKLWEHYAALYQDVGFDLNVALPGLRMSDTGASETGLTYVHRIIHSQWIDTSAATRTGAIRFRSDKAGELAIPYQNVAAFLQRAAIATRDIHGYHDFTKP